MQSKNSIMQFRNPIMQFFEGIMEFFCLHGMPDEGEQMHG